MQKKLIALAVAGVFAAPAFAATSNVDVYGQINLSVESVDDGADTNTRMVTNNNSFIGFKGSEDLGGGMKAIWQLETNISFDSTSSGKAGSDAATNSQMWGTRNSYVGLSTGFGTVIGGTHDTPYKLATGPLDMFVGTLGDYNGIFGSAGVVQSNPSSLFDLRTGNTIAYLSPNFSGFDIKAAYVIGGETASSGQDGSDAWSVSGTYSNGPLFVTAAYETHNNTATSSACNTGAVCLGAASVGPDQDSWKVGIGYTIGDLKLGAAYESMSLDKQNAVIYGTTYSGVDGSHDAWLVNASYKIGAFTLKGEYVTADDLDNVNNSGADMWAVGVDYTMSKRTKLQLTYADMNNDSVGGWALGQGAQVVPHTTGEDVNGISLGIVHSF